MGATLLLLLTGRDVMAGRMTLGDLVLINAFLMQIYIPVSSFGFAYREIKHVLADMEGMFALLDHAPAVSDRAEAPALVATTGFIQFSHVDFGYELNRQIKNPRILILDEATAALDFQSEKELQADLYSVTRHYSTLVIAHRLSTIVQADEILVLDQGRIAERGQHEPLLAAGGVYTRLWLAQQRDST